jgi:predicted ribosome quality control (RQC) complex YloA/Tae2 family protein
MYKNFYLFYQQIEEIKPTLLGALIHEVFTFRKNELIIVAGEPLKYLMMAPDINFPYLLLKAAASIRQPKYHLFAQLSGQHIMDILMVAFDKHVRIETQDFFIDAVFYGVQPNIFLYEKSGSMLASFKNGSPPVNPRQTDACSLLNFSSDRLRRLFKQESVCSVSAFLKNNIAALNARLIDEIIYRSGVNASDKINALSPEAQSRLMGVLNDLHNNLNGNICYLYNQAGQTKTISIFRLSQMETAPDTNWKEFTSRNECWSVFITGISEADNFRKLYLPCRQALEKRREYLEKSIKHLQNMQDMLALKEAAEQKGNLLLANKHRIKPGLSEVELENIFSETLEMIKIKLNPKKSVAENAAQYFTKYKDIDKRKTINDIKQSTFDGELKQVEALYKKLLAIKGYAALVRIYKSLEMMRLIQTAAPRENRNDEHLRFSFNRLILEKEWDIYIGRNGENNDLLTFGFANKWDIWLHAQGVPGSHVIIRLPRKNILPPARVLEQAAQLAAAHSKAQHATTVPVIYTEARYVSRMRKSLPGTVSVKNEKVIFVSPMKL